MQYIKNTFKKLINDESGQGATEYILLLVVVVAIASLFRGKIMELIEAKMGQISGKIGEFNP